MLVEKAADRGGYISDGDWGWIDPDRGGAVNGLDDLLGDIDELALVVEVGVMGMVSRGQSRDEGVHEERRERESVGGLHIGYWW